MRLFEWTPERAAAVVKAGGYVLHTADRVSDFPGGEQLWKATEQDARDAGEPLARILNRYDGARRLAGMVDEAEFAAAMFAYAKRNLKMRGAVIRHARDQQPDVPRYGAAAFEEMQTPPAGASREPVVERIAEPPPAFVDETGPEDPNQPEGFVFDPWAAR